MIIGGAALLSACSYTKIVEPVSSCAAVPATVSYQKDVLPILQEDCYRCHNAQEYRTRAQGTLNMENFSSLQYWATPANGLKGQSWLIGSMRHEPGFNAMPYDGREGPDACEIALIKAWVDAGMLNN